MKNRRSQGRKQVGAVKAYMNPGFLKGKDARPIRILSEFLEPLSRFKYYGVKDIIVFFGSARIMSKRKARQELLAVKRKIRGLKRVTRVTEKELKGAETAFAMSKYYEDAVELAGRLTRWSMSLKDKNRFVVCTGGGPGIMEAANRGALLAGGKSMGLNISLPFEQSSNKYISPELNLEFHYFFMRKYWFMYLGKALVAFPGGFGTLDELMELLTLLQTRRIKKKMTVILYGREFWEHVINFRTLADRGVISDSDFDHFKFADTPTEAFKLLRSGLVKNYPEKMI